MSTTKPEVHDWKDMEKALWLRDIELRDRYHKALGMIMQHPEATPSIREIIMGAWQ